ncbi:MAG: oligosaccharide flippase family protein [Methanomassiliicoccales archaeon]
MIGRKSFLVFSTLILTFTLQLVGMLLLTQLFPPDVYGSITFALSFVATFDCLANLGFNSAHIKRISEGRDIADCVSTFTTVKLGLTFSMAVIVLVSMLIWTELLGHYLSPVSRALIEVFLVYQVMYDIVSIAILTFNARTEMSKAYLVNLLDPLARIPIIAILAWAGGDIYQVSLAYVVGSSLVLLVGLRLLARERIPWKRPTLFRSYLAFALPMAPIAVLETLSNNIDKLLIGAIGDTTGVAYYAAAKYLLCGLGAVGLALSLNAFPAFSSACHRGNLREVKRMAREAERLISILITPLVIVLVLFPTEVCIFVFGPKFSSSGEPLRYLSVATLLVVLNQVYLSQILGMNRPRISARITFLDFIVFLGLMLYLIPPHLFGIPTADMSFSGAALAAAITSLITTFVTRFVVWRLIDTRPNPRMLLHAAAAIFTSVSLAIFSTFIQVHEIYDVVLYGILAYSIFELILLITRELSRKDVWYILSILNLAEMWKYVRRELRGK